MLTQQRNVQVTVFYLVVYYAYTSRACHVYNAFLHFGHEFNNVQDVNTVFWKFTFWHHEVVGSGRV